MNILITWIGPLRAICMAIDGILYSFLDNAYTLVIKLSTAELLKHSTIKSITGNLYIIFGVVAFFRLALLLVNAIIDPEKLNEKGKGLSNIFFRVVGMIILLFVTPFLFEMSYDLQGKLVGADASENIIFKTILGSNANIASSDDSNAGKALQNIALSSLITIDKEYLVNDKQCNVGENDCGFYPLTCVPNNDDEGTCTLQGGYVYGDNCDWSNCQNAVDKYNEMYVAEDMSPAKLAAYAGTSKKIEVEGVDDKQEVYVYNYMFIITGVVGVAMTYIIISFAIDIAVRMFELVVLEILSPLFIATFVDPKSAQSGPFKNWLSAVGKSYISLYIRLAILALMVLLISIINQSKMFQSMGNVSGWAKIFMVIGLLIFAKKAPSWIGDMIGIKGDGGLGGLSIGKKLGGMALAGGLASKGLEKGKDLRNKVRKAGSDFVKRRIDDALSRAVTGIGAHASSMKLSKGGNKKYADRLKDAKKASAAARAELKAEQRKAEPRIFEKLQDMYDRGAKAVDPDYKNKRKNKIDKLEAKASGIMDLAIKSGAMKNAATIAKIQDEQEKNKKAKVMSANNKLLLDNDGNRMKIVSPVNGETVNLDPQGPKELNSSINYARTVEDAYDALGRNRAAFYGYSSDSSGRVIDSNGKVIAASMAELGQSSLSYTGQLAVQEQVSINLQKEVSDYKNNVEQKEKYEQEMAANNQRLFDMMKNIKEIRQDNPEVDTNYNIIEKYDEQKSELQEKSQKVYDLKSKMQQLLAGRNFNDLPKYEQANYIQLNNDYKNKMEDFNSLRTNLKKATKEYSSAKAFIAPLENQWGVTQLKYNVEALRQKASEYDKYVKAAEDKFENTSVMKYDDEGKPTGTYVNPYKVKIEGVEYSPKDNFSKINDIINVLQINSEKTSKKAKEALEEELKKSEKTGDK